MDDGYDGEAGTVWFGLACQFESSQASPIDGGSCWLESSGSVVLTVVDA